MCISELEVNRCNFTDGKITFLKASESKDFFPKLKVDFRVNNLTFPEDRGLWNIRQIIVLAD